MGQGGIYEMKGENATKDLYPTCFEELQRITNVQCPMDKINDNQAIKVGVVGRTAIPGL